MSEIKTGLWQNNLDGSFIKVRSVGLTVISYNDEGCKGVYNMGVSVLLDNYRLYKADKPKPDVDDTFNDDTPMRLIGIAGPARAGRMDGFSDRRPLWRPDRHGASPHRKTCGRAKNGGAGACSYRRSCRNSTA